MFPRAAALALILGLAAPIGLAAPAVAEDGVALTQAMAAVGAKAWDDAAARARASGPLATDLVAWHALRAGSGRFGDYLDFVARNGDWEMLASERPRGAFSRQLVLGDNLDLDRIEAAYDGGVLRLIVPVAEKAKPRKIEIGSSGDSERQAIQA